jgi:FkbM family methyltransferase
MRPIRSVISTCTLKDAGTWYYSSQAIHRYIAAENYYVIAPAAEVAVFEAISPPEFRVVSEDSLLNGLSLDYLVQRMPAENRSRASWYFQQLIKLASLITLDSSPEDLLLIWDADNVPVRPLSFCNPDGQIIYRSSNGYHPPYFAMIDRLLGLKKTGDFSFIAQCFPIWRRWMTEFVSCVERRWNKHWIDAILQATNLAEFSGFSEYETLGTYLRHAHADEIVISAEPWEHRGYARGFTQQGLLDSPQLAGELAFVGFEAYDAPSAPAEFGRDKPTSVDAFLDGFFGKSQPERNVVQVGANDGVMADPLRPFLCDQVNDHIFAVLIEPLKFYFDKLKKLYENRPNTALLNIACGSVAATRKLYFIDPAIASEMNGEGPQNDWAHGQGSFDKEIVEYWIRENSFRGARYVERMKEFMSAITSTDVVVVPLNRLRVQRAETLLLLDVQGAELDVLAGLDWSVAPQWIVVKQDRGRNRLIDGLLAAFEYEYLCGSDNVLFSRRPRLSGVPRDEISA